MKFEAVSFTKALAPNSIDNDNRPIDENLDFGMRPSMRGGCVMKLAEQLLTKTLLR